jgi:hypothetical protein
MSGTRDQCLQPFLSVPGKEKMAWAVGGSRALCGVRPYVFEILWRLLFLFFFFSLLLVRADECVGLHVCMYKYMD